MANNHVMTTEPHRFRWRYCNIDETGTRLMSPIDGRTMRTGRPSFEAAVPASKPLRSKRNYPDTCSLRHLHYVPDATDMADFTASILDKAPGACEPRSSHLRNRTPVESDYPDTATPIAKFTHGRYSALALVLCEPPHLGTELGPRGSASQQAATRSRRALQPRRDTAPSHHREPPRHPAHRLQAAGCDQTSQEGCSLTLYSANQKYPPSNHICDVHLETLRVEAVADH